MISSENCESRSLVAFKHAQHALSTQVGTFVPTLDCWKFVFGASAMLGIHSFPHHYLPVIKIFI